MKEKLTKNIGLKILSLALAFFLWIVILNEDNPVVNRNFYNIPVEFINQESVEEKDKVFEVVKGDRVDITVKGKRNTVENISVSDIRAVADLSLLSFMNAVDISVTLPKFSDSIEIVSRSITSAKVKLENLNTGSFKVNVITSGEVAKNYYIKEKIASPNIIQITGAETNISKIGDVVVNVDVSNINGSLTQKVEPKVFDKNGTLMDSSKLTFDHEQVAVSVNLLQTKTIPLHIELTGTPAYGYEYSKFEYEPKQVIIAGTKEELDKTSYISFKYDINNQVSDLEGEIQIEDYITTENVLLIDENQTAAFKLKVEKLDNKEITFGGTDIKFIDIPEGMTAVINDESEYTVKIYGKTSSLNKVTRYSLNPYINLNGAVRGTKIMNVQFDLEDESLTPSSPYVNVTLE